MYLIYVFFDIQIEEFDQMILINLDFNLIFLNSILNFNFIILNYFPIP